MLDVGFLTLCLRKEKMKREKRRGRKTAKRMQTRVSVLSGLGVGMVLPGAHGGRHPAEGRIVTETWPAWAFPCGAGRGLLVLYPFTLCPCSSQTKAVGGNGPCLAR